jgi:3-deoxy-7-phosphoheptulonate synthase
MASGLSAPVGFKNGTDGNVLVAIQGIISAMQPHRFLGINSNGQCCLVQTKGNRFGHLVLRGSKTPNYDQQSISAAAYMMEQSGIAPNIIVDCSHGNSNKDHKRQPHVFRTVLEQMRNGSNAVVGLMLESNLLEGRQDLSAKPLQRGVSITDACISWEDTEKLVYDAAEAL